MLNSEGFATGVSSFMDAMGASQDRRDKRKAREEDRLLKREGMAAEERMFDKELKFKGEESKFAHTRAMASQKKHFDDKKEFFELTKKAEQMKFEREQEAKDFKRAFDHYMNFSAAVGEAWNQGWSEEQVKQKFQPMAEALKAMIKKGGGNLNKFLPEGSDFDVIFEQGKAPKFLVNEKNGVITITDPEVMKSGNVDKSKGLEGYGIYKFSTVNENNEEMVKKLINIGVPPEQAVRTVFRTKGSKVSNGTTSAVEQSLIDRRTILNKKTNADMEAMRKKQENIEKKANSWSPDKQREFNNFINNVLMVGKDMVYDENGSITLTERGKKLIAEKNKKMGNTDISDYIYNTIARDIEENKKIPKEKKKGFLKGVYDSIFGSSEQSTEAPGTPGQNNVSQNVDAMGKKPTSKTKAFLDGILNNEDSNTKAMGKKVIPPDRILTDALANTKKTSEDNKRKINNIFKNENIFKNKNVDSMGKSDSNSVSTNDNKKYSALVKKVYGDSKSDALMNTFLKRSFNSARNLSREEKIQKVAKNLSNKTILKKEEALFIVKKWAEQTTGQK